MKIHKEDNNQITFEREDWKEWFRFGVGGFMCTDEQFVVPKGYYKVYSLWDRDVDIYWFVLCVPFVRIWLFLKKAWWIIPKWLYKKGYFKHEEGEVEHWFWFKKIRIFYS